jgi:hypothetical protein
MRADARADQPRHFQHVAARVARRDRPRGIGAPKVTNARDQ